MFDCNSFLNRKGWKQRELAKRLEIGTSTVGMWCTGQSTPSYGVIEQLIRLGMTAQEIFGKELSDILQVNSEIKPEVASSIFDSQEFRDEIKKALVEMYAAGNMPDFSKSNNFLDRQIKEDTSEEK